MRESSLVLCGEDIIDVQIGSGAEVKFDFDHVWAYRKHKENIKFYHVHPQGFLGISGTDVNCMKGYKIALGIPSYFSVICFKDEHELNDIQYEQLSVMIEDNKIEVCPNLILPPAHIFLLKALSYNLKEL